MKTALIAFDKFKDALSAHEACDAAATSLARLKPDWKISSSPLADGGDGFCDTLTRICSGSFQSCTVTGPLEIPTKAVYGLVETESISSPARQRLQLPDNARKLAIIEFAQSSGIALIPQEERSPWTTTSFGLGETILHAAEHGADALLIGLGGSATNDLGLGALQALGYRMLDAQNKELTAAPTPERWSEIRSIEAPENGTALPVRIACDVENPLLGPIGATAVFGPQKGLLPSDFNALESEMNRLAILLCHATSSGIQIMDTPGTGAAGGAALGLLAGMDGKIVSGAELVFDWSDLPSKLAAADLVITGEGRFDASSLLGKGPGALAQRTLELDKELLILAGSLGELPAGGLRDAAFAITPPGTPLQIALRDTAINIAAAIEARFGNKKAGD